MFLPKGKNVSAKHILVKFENICFANLKIEGEKMNICFLIGKIVSNIEFRFIIKNKNKAISEFTIKTLDNNIIEIYGYDEIADNCYSRLKNGDNVLVYGSLRSSGKLELKSMQFIDKN